MKNFNASIYGKMFYDFLEKNITPLLNKHIVFVDDRNCAHGFEVGYIFFLIKKNPKNILYNYRGPIYQKQENDISIFCTIFPDNETFFEFNKGTDHDYVIIAHIDVDHKKEIQFVMNQACSLYMFNKPYEPNKSIYDHVKNELIAKQKNQGIKDYKIPYYVLSGLAPNF